MLRTAWSMLRVEPPYRSGAFEAGFRALGYEPKRWDGQQIAEDDVLVVWNKTARMAPAIAAARASGAPVIVTENGYFGEHDGLQTYALALDGHCGSGRWYEGGADRFKTLWGPQVKFQPWREPRKDSHILICDQRGIGSELMRSPGYFADDLWAKLRKRYPTKLRRHPGREPMPPLAQHLENCRLVLVWSSNVATEALRQGIPVMYLAPYIASAKACTRYDITQLEDPPRPNRMAGFASMAWQQADLGEVRSGVALQRLLDVHSGKLPEAQKGAGL